MTNLRISIVTETCFPQVNGVSRTLNELIDYCLGRGDRLQLIAPRYDEHYPMPAAVDRREWGARTLPFYPEVKLPLVSARSLRSNLAGFEPHLVHIATEGPLGRSALKAARRLGLPVVSSYHTNFPDYLGRYRLGALKAPAWTYLRRFHNATLATFCPTPSIREMLVEKGFENVGIWSRGVDPYRFHPRNRDLDLRRQLGFAPAEKVLCYVGRLAAEKNLDMLFDAWRQLPHRQDCRLLLIGDGPLREKLEAAGDERVVFAGYRYGEELARMVASADLFVFPSLSETFGNVIQEAMASGLPVVGFDAPGPRDIIRDDETGRVVRDISATAFAYEVTDLLAHPYKLYAMRHHARAFAETRSWEAVHGELRDHYLRLATSAEAPQGRSVHVRSPLVQSH